MSPIATPSAEQIVLVNKYVCEQGGNPHHCFDIGKVESAIHAAFYPGEWPFAAGAIANVAGALCFYLINGHAFVDGNKRTGALSAIAFLNSNGLDVKYNVSAAGNYDEFATVIEECAAGRVTKDQLMQWFGAHVEPIVF